MLLVFLAGAAVLSAQAPGQPLSGRVMLYVDEVKDGPLSADQLFMMSRSALLGLQSAVPGLQLIELASGSLSPASEKSLTRRAAEGGAASWIWLQASGDRSRIVVRARAFDLPSGTNAFDQSIERDGGFSAPRLASDSWSDLAALVQQGMPAAVPVAAAASSPSAASGSEPGGAVLTVRARPGTEVTGPKGMRAVADADGVARLSLAARAEYTLRSTRAGFYADTQRVFVSGDQELVLHQAAASRWAIDASMFQMAYPGVEGSYFLVPNWIYVKLGFTTYLFGLALNDAQVFSSNPLTNIVAQAGSYLRPEDVVFRPYVNVGAFLRFVHAPGVLVGIDPVSWGGLQASLGTEIGSNPHGRFFFEFQPMMYFSSVQGLLEASLAASSNDSDTPTGWLFFSAGGLDLLCFRVGYRWML